MHDAFWRVKLGLVFQSLASMKERGLMSWIVVFSVRFTPTCFKFVPGGYASDDSASCASMHLSIARVRSPWWWVGPMVGPMVWLCEVGGEISSCRMKVSASSKADLATVLSRDQCYQLFIVASSIRDMGDGYFCLPHWVWLCGYVESEITLACFQTLLRDNHSLHL